MVKIFITYPPIKPKLCIGEVVVEISGINQLLYGLNPFMFRMWAKIIKDTRIEKDTVISISDYSLSRTSMVFQALEDICYQFDLEKPMWLDSTVKDFQKHSKTRFTQDNFIERIEFDFLEVQVIEE